MRKQEFLDALRTRLLGLPMREVGERLSFYSEMIDDRMEEGMSEADAVADVGSVEAVAAQIISDIPLSRIAKERFSPKRRLGAWEIVLLILGSPIWLSLEIAALSVILALYAVIWSLVVSLWAVFASLAACALGGVLGGGVFLFVRHAATGIALIGAGIFCAGLSIFLFFVCVAATKGTGRLTRKIALWIKKCFVKKEGAR